MSPEITPPRLSDAVRGIILMGLGVLMFPFLNTAAKLLTSDYPVWQIVWARFLGHLLFALIAFLPGRGWRLFVAHRPLTQIARSFLLLGSTVFYMSAIGRVPLATASAISFVSPIMVTALSVPLLKEAVGPRRWTAVVVGFVGTLVVIRPTGGLIEPAIALLLCCSACYSLYQIATRRIGVHDSAETGIVYAALVGTIATSLVVPFDFKMPVRATDLLLFASTGLFGALGHYFVIQSLRLGPVALMAPLGYLELVGTTILGYLVFNNFPDHWTWAGAALIIASGLYIALREQRRRRN
jgi:drug/metabolite transporter (DMT)-like permease